MITRDLQVMIIQALRFQYLTPFGADIFEIELRNYRCPILKFSHNLIFPAILTIIIACAGLAATIAFGLSK